MAAEQKTPRTPRAPRVELKVTEDEIRVAVQKDSSHCLWAEAVRVAYPDASHISVDLQSIRFSDRKKRLRYTYLTPRPIQVGIVDFDQGVTPEPVTCLLRNGQVTEMAGTRSNVALSDAQIAQRSEAGKQGQVSLAKARLVSWKKSDAAIGVVPDRVGGKTPPLGSFARRRAFGLRGLKR